MEFPFGEQKNLIDVGEMLADLRQKGFKGRIDDKLREELGGGSNEKINPYKKAAINVHEEAVRYRIKHPEFFLDVCAAYFGRYEEMGWRRAQRDLEERDSVISTLNEKVVSLEETNRGIESENASLNEETRAAQVEHGRIQTRADEREKAAEGRIQELLRGNNDLSKAAEQASARAAVQDQAFQDSKRQLDQVTIQYQQLTSKNQELSLELVTAREELTVLRVHREADQTRLLENKTEITSLKARDSSREDEIRRLNDELRTVERHRVEADQRATTFQLEVERLRGQLESPTVPSQDQDEKKTARTTSKRTNSST